MDRESLQVVAEDLAFLASWGPGIPDADLRRGSATLRRLLVESAYPHAWRAAGFEREPSVVAVDLGVLLAKLDLTRVLFALACGASFRGLEVGVAVAMDGEDQAVPEAPPSQRADGFPWERRFHLSEYLASPSSYAFGSWATRADVIKYIANVKGGVHLSPSQRRREQALIERLAPMDSRIVVAGTNGLFLETLAIAQAIGRSEDAKALVHRIGA